MVRLSTSTLNWLIEQLLRFREQSTRFLFALGLLLAALLVYGGAQFIFGSAAAPLFAIAVGLGALLFGLMAGICTALLAMLAFDFFCTPPIFALTMDSATLRAGFGFAVLAVASDVVGRRIFTRIKKEAPLFGIKGVLDGIKNGEIYGWAFNPDHPSSPVFLTTSVNHRPVAYVAAVHYRPDVAEFMSCSGKHGFYVDLSRVFPVDTDALVDVCLSNGRSLANSPRMMSIPASDCPDKPTVLFMHIPKTAGSAFRRAISANYRESEIAYVYPTRPGFLVSDLRELPLEQRRAFRLVVGHFQFGVHEALPQEAQYITIIREPSTRVLSLYAYLCQAQPELVTERGRLLPLKKLLEQKLMVDFDNCIVRCFSGVAERQFPPGTLNQEVFDRAVHNLRTAFTFVGHQECSAASFAWLQKYFGWYATAGLQEVNRGALRSVAEPDAALDEAIRHHNEWDYLFYEVALRLFPRTDSGSATLAAKPALRMD